MLFISFIFMPAYPPGRVAGTTSTEELGITHDPQPFQIVLLIPRHGGVGAEPSPESF